MRKIIAIFMMTTLILFSATSCVKKNELNEAAIVQAIGIDMDDAIFVLTLQIYSPKGAGGTTAIDTSKNNSTIIETRGETIAEAIKLATLLQGKTIFTGHNRILVLGKNLCTTGIKQIFSYFNRSALTRQNVQVLMSDTSAKEVVTTNIEQGILAAETIEKMVQNGSQNGMSYQCPFYELSKTMSTAHGSGAMPIIKVQKIEQDPQNSDDKPIQNVNKLELSGTAIFEDYKFISALNHSETRGLLLISNRLDESVIVCSLPELGKVSIQLYNSKTKLSVEADGNFLLTGTLRGRLDEVLQSQTLPEDAILELENSCKHIISNEISTAFNHTVRDSSSDFLQIKDRILKKDKVLWNTLMQDSNGSFDYNSLKIKTAVDIKINRIGLESDEKF